MEARDAFLSSLASGGSSKRHSLLMRYTDDFLLITTSKRVATKFYTVMRDGHPDYGCFISPEKTLTNFDLLDTMSAAGPLVPRIYSDDFAWCGLTLNTRDLGVSTDLARYAGLDMRDTLTVEYSRRPGAALVEKMITSVKSRCHVLFTDTSLNGSRRVYANVYASFLVAALKFAAYLGELRRFKVVFRAEFLFGAIQRLVRFTSRYIGSRVASARAKLYALGSTKDRRSGRGRRGKAWRVSCALQPRYVHWLGYSAFQSVLSPHAARKTKHGGANLRSPNYRSLDAVTRKALVSLIETCAMHSCYSAARRRLASVAASALNEARKSLQI
ncbi:hypothetical protein EX895_000996 [Sporisorium graminicola]|uniref:Telomerase reverse transcriptase n=1 Tax=Sporisorium graminicola TaxID=280036 RepID=A0A4U7L2M2_9BASI|nr:hypothetical protein EX895_000996 [Sporisorium graminicola]TKY90997.1 hypothetical protein EX895_000996 [Sporisorium graminicola]